MNARPGPECVTVLCGGTGPERAVSLKSGQAVAEALGRHLRVERVTLEEDKLPPELDPEKTVVFPALHGGFGEDGRLQAQMDAVGLVYAGSGAEASALCMDKAATKQLARRHGLAVADALVFDGDAAPRADDVIAEMGPSLVVKPANEGSSVGLMLTEHRSELGLALSKICGGRWMVERRLRGRELTVGLLGGAAMGVIEILSGSGAYDYTAKYTPGGSEYRVPAELPEALARRIRSQAERLFAACGCRDFARIDFILEDSTPYLLEVNSLPGLTGTSLLPMSASCQGYDFAELAMALVRPAMERFSNR